MPPPVPLSDRKAFLCTNFAHHSDEPPLGHNQRLSSAVRSHLLCRWLEQLVLPLIKCKWAVWSFLCFPYARSTTRSLPTRLLRRPSRLESTEERLDALRIRLNGIGARLASGLAVVDAKVEERLITMEDRLNPLKIIVSTQRLNNFSHSPACRTDYRIPSR